MEKKCFYGQPDDDLLTVFFSLFNNEAVHFILFGFKSYCKLFHQHYAFY